MFKSKSGKGFSNANMARVQDARDQQGHEHAHPGSDKMHSATPPVDPKHRVAHVSEHGDSNAANDGSQATCPNCGHSFDANAGPVGDSTGFAQ